MSPLKSEKAISPTTKFSLSWLTLNWSSGTVRGSWVQPGLQWQEKPCSDCQIIHAGTTSSSVLIKVITWFSGSKGNFHRGQGGKEASQPPDLKETSTRVCYCTSHSISAPSLSVLRLHHAWSQKNKYEEIRRPPPKCLATWGTIYETKIKFADLPKPWWMFLTGTSGWLHCSKAFQTFE